MPKIVIVIQVTQLKTMEYKSSQQILMFVGYRNTVTDILVPVEIKADF
jgi:hypothetical protein